MYVFYDVESNAVFILPIGSRPVFVKENARLTSMSDLEDAVYEMAQQSRTTKVWVYNVIKPMFLMMRFGRTPNGLQSLHHTDCLYYGQLSGMFIETNWTRKGYGPGGVIEMTKNPQKMASWVTVCICIHELDW